MAEYKIIITFYKAQVVWGIGSYFNLTVFYNSEGDKNKKKMMTVAERVRMNRAIIHTYTLLLL